MNRPSAWLLAAAFVLAWFGTLGLRPLYKADESRYGEIPREMAASGDWVTPRLNGIKYFEKPPLQYWVTAAIYKVIGVSDFAARLWTALAGFCGILVAWAAGNRLFGSPAGHLGAALLLASPLYVLGAQLNTLDMGLTFFLSAAVFAFAIAQRDGERRWMLAFWASCALAVLSKGLIGIVLPLGAIALYVLARRDRALLSRMELLRGGALFLTIAAPWFVAVSLANDEFLRFFFVQEHFQRFLTKMHHRYHPAWYFVPVLAGGAAPWLLGLGAAWLRAFRRDREAGFRPALFLALWAAVVFAFFSASGSKLPGYILPMFPALAVLTGAWLADGSPRRLLLAQSALAAGTGIALGALALGLTRSLLAADIAALVPAYVPWLAAAAALLTIASLGALAAAWRDRTRLAVGLIALGSFACVQLALAGHRTLSPAYSVGATVAALPAAPASDARVFAVDSYDHTMPWTLRRPVTMVRYKDELEAAIAWQPDKFIPDLQRFAQAWMAAPAAYAFIAVRDFDRVRAEAAVPMEIVARGPRYLIVRRP